jgi:RimJ/RimL family protein N-acetyltransferase
VENEILDMSRKYIFKSERLGFRAWTKEDLLAFSEINADPAVMEHFPKPLTVEESDEFIDRLIAHYEKHGYQYFATEILATQELVGFIGLAFQRYKTEFSPATDIGWRLKKSVWGNGYATEGAKRCLAYAFDDLGLKKVFSACTQNNLKSEHIMRKIGMKKMGEFNHPNLKGYPALEKCVWYEVTRK